MRQKTLDGNSWYSLPRPVIHKVFRYRNFFGTQHRRVPLRNVLVLWDNKLLTEKRDTHSTPTKFFGAVGQYNFDGKSWYLHHPLSSVFSIPQIIWNTIRLCYEVIGYCETKCFRRKLVVLIPPDLLFMKFFYTRTILERSTEAVPLRKFLVLSDNSFSTENCNTHSPSPPKFFGTLGQNNLDKKSWYPPARLFLTVFDGRKFLKNRKVPLRNL